MHFSVKNINHKILFQVEREPMERYAWFDTKVPKEYVAAKQFAEELLRCSDEINRLLGGEKRDVVKELLFERVPNVGDWEYRGQDILFRYGEGQYLAGMYGDGHVGVTTKDRGGRSDVTVLIEHLLNQ